MSFQERVIWAWLRQSRYQPPSEASTDESRRGIFQSAMQQFDDLMVAARATALSARPLPLFYALSQASQAIIASRGGKSPPAHGLRLIRPVNPILDSEIEPETTHGNFWELARVLDSSGIGEPCSIGEVLFSLPELSPPLVPIVPMEQNLSGPAFKPTPFGRGIDALWEVKSANEIEPEYRWFDKRWLRPSVKGSAPSAPIVSWWAILFGLSMLARYYPTVWIASLDRNYSNEAATLEFVLDEALEALPQLVLEAISGQTFPILPPDLR